MRKKIDYSEMCEGALNNLREINGLAKEFSNFEMTAGVKDEIGEILELSDTSKYKGKDKETFAEIAGSLVQIQESLGEIEMITGELIKKVNKMPEEDKKDVYDFMRIKEVEKEDEGISDDRLNLIFQMIQLASEILDESSKYFNLDKEGYVDYEDKISKE